ncbi:MAG: serine hydrolase [Flavobacteriales bacterium]
MKYILSVLMLLAAISHCNAQTDYFPPVNSDEWETMPLEDLNWCQEKVDSMVNFVENNNSKAFIILKDGKIVVEEYFDDFTQDSTWYWASAGKTMTAFLVGLAQDQGLLSIDEPSSSYLGEGWTSLTPEQEEQITIWHQLTMTTGLDYNIKELDCTDPNCLTYLNEPGEAWFYHNAPYTRLDGVLENATGSGLNLYLFNQLSLYTGITGAYVPVGFNNVLFSKPRSMARFGHLLLNEGVWNGLTLLNDNDYFQSMTTTSQELNEAYGYLTWVNNGNSFMMPSLDVSFPGNIISNAPFDMYSAQGKNGQIINVVPSERLVIMRMGDLPDDGSLIPVLFNDFLWEYLNDLECEPDLVSGFNENDFKIYPNPAEGFIQVDTPLKEYQITLLDSSGRTVLSVKNKSRLNVYHLQTGVYALQLSSKHHTISRKVIIE